MIYFTLQNDDYPSKSQGGITPSFWPGFPQYEQSSRTKIPRYELLTPTSWNIAIMDISIPVLRFFVDMRI